MTWKELKEAVEAKGVKDDDQIEFIELHSTSFVAVKRDEERGTAQIYDEF